MQRIAIVGCSGGGKSTLALELGARLGLPVVHLDNLYWKPGWTHSDLEEMRPKVEALAAGERWVIEGNFTGASALRFARADTIVWIDLPTWLCLWRAFARMLLAFGTVRPDLAPGCPERFDLEFYRYIWSWNRLTRPGRIGPGRAAGAAGQRRREVCLHRRTGQLVSGGDATIVALRSLCAPRGRH